MTTTTATITTRSLEELREFADLEEFFEMLDAGEPAEVVAFEACRGGEALDLEFARALLMERCGVELDEADTAELVTVAEILDPAKGFPTREAGAKAAVIFTMLAEVEPEQREAHAWGAAYCVEAQGIGFDMLIRELHPSLNA